MNTDEVLKKYRARLTKQAILKSVILGLLISFSALAVSGFVIWMTGYKKFWISFIVFGVVFIAATVLFYFLKYKPDEYYVARQIDALGLEERVVTMHEFKGKNDYIYERQRQDAVSKVSSVSEKLLKFTMPLALMIILPLVIILGTGTTVLSTLSAEGVIKSGEQIINEAEDERNKRYFEVVYLVDGNGIIIDEEIQLVEAGKSANPVMAVAEDEWAFVMWSDGLDTPTRVDSNVFENMTITAYFAPASGDSPFQGEGNKDKEGDQDNGRPSDQGQPGDEGDGPSDNASDNPGGTAGGGKYDPANQIIDGETYYGGDIYQEYYNQATDALSQDGSTDKGEKDYIEDYFKIIAE